MKLPSMLFLALALTGSTAYAADPIPLRAGPLTMLLDTDRAFLRYVNVGPHEVLRGINAPIRDEFWGTVQPRISNLEVHDGGDHFTVTFDALCQEGDIDFRWRGTLTGNREGGVEFTFDGVAHSSFKRSRIGFCLLHGPSAAGQPWVVETVDGKRSEGRFPKHISPHQPAKNIRAIEHEVAPGIRARVEFEGEIFEMEDQRNWTDASFKTYCTPLEIPYPVQIAKGTKISQKLRFRVEGDIPKGPADERIVLTLGKQQSALPRLGVQVSEEVDHLTGVQRARLKALHLDHLRVELALSDESFVEKLHRATEQAEALGVSLQVGLLPGEQPAWTRLVEEVKKTKPPVSMWLVLSGDQDHYRKAREHLKPVQGKGRIGVGRNTNFVDLNRERPTDKTIEAVAFAINPQIHAIDIASIVETLPIQGDAVRSAREFVGKTPVVISPITLRPEGFGRKPLPGELPFDVDPRQPALFTAAWTIGSVKYLAEAGAASATYYQTVGWKGIMDADNVGSRPPEFPSRPGAVFDVYHVLRLMGEFAGGQVQHLDSSDPLKVVGLVLRKPGRMRLLIANLTDRPQSFGIRGFGESAEVQVLDEAATLAAGANPDRLSRRPSERVLSELPLRLPPFAVAKMDREVD